MCSAVGIGAEAELPLRRRPPTTAWLLTRHALRARSASPARCRRAAACSSRSSSARSRDAELGPRVGAAIGAERGRSGVLEHGPSCRRARPLSAASWRLALHQPVQVVQPGLGQVADLGVVDQDALHDARLELRASSCASGSSRAAALSWLISSTQAPSSLTTWSQLPARAASSMSALACLDRFVVAQRREVFIVGSCSQWVDAHGVRRRGVFSAGDRRPGVAQRLHQARGTRRAPLRRCAGWPGSGAG